MMMLDLKQLIGMDVKELIGDLQAISAKSAEHAALPAKVARLKAGLATTTKELDRASKELETAETRLSALQTANKKQYANELEAMQARLYEAWQAEERANRELARINTEIRDRRVILDGLAAAVAQLLTRLGGRQPADEGIIERLSSASMHD
jgi:chromosome segregation ATPase